MIKHKLIYHNSGFFLIWVIDLPYRLIPTDTIHSDLMDELDTDNPADIENEMKFWKEYHPDCFEIEAIEAGPNSIDVFLKKVNKKAY